MKRIAPSVLSADFLNLEKELRAIDTAGADLIHLDVMDGHFVPNLTFGFPIVERISQITQLPLDMHLMVTNPQDYIQLAAKTGIKYLSFHQETAFHIHRIISQIKEAGIKAGVALNPATPVQTLLPVLPDLDFILLMSVNPGFGGQSFLPLVIDKIKELDLLRKNKNLDFEIEIDGGVTNNNAQSLWHAGADILVAGSYIFKSLNYADSIRSLK